MRPWLSSRSRALVCAVAVAVAGCGGSDPGAGGPDAAAGSDAAAGADAVVPECTSAPECVTLHGAPPCGAWECNGGLCEVACPGCTDADGDGFGVEATPGACAGPDCDDADAAVHDAVTRSCYSGDPGTAGTGACQAGTEVCAAGVWAPCQGEVTPSGEACNGQDDDCDGSDDDGLGSFGCGLGACAATVAACAAGAVGVCVPGPQLAANDLTCDGVDDDCDGAIDENCPNCVTVAKTGNDANAIATDNATPFLTIQAAIDWAAADASRPRVVCVASSPACGGSATYVEPVVMADGVHVYGRYESTLFTRCAGGTTVIQPGVAAGVVFPATVVSPTAIDGFRIDRSLTSTTSGITVDGAQGVIISAIEISTTPTVTSSYAINLINGAEALITGAVLYGGNGTSESIGVRSVGSRPTIRANCQTLDGAGRCNDFCGGVNRGIRGHFGAGTTGETWAVLLEDSPGAVIEQTALCGVNAQVGAGVRIRGDAAGTVIRANLINAWGGEVDSHGIWMEDCAGAAPWIVDNRLIAAAGDQPTTRVDGIRAIGDCHPVIDSNVDIAGGGEGGTSGANGVYCGANPAGVASQCVILGNPSIRGSSNGYPPTSVGVRCEGDGCMRIEGNSISGVQGVDAWGLWLGATGAFVNDNLIVGGCGLNSATGVYAEDSFARLQNNRIFGGACNTSGVAPGSFVGLQVVALPGGHELDVHSNVIAGGGAPVACSSIGVNLTPGATAPTGGVGVFRNNILRAGPCTTERYPFAESDPAADPRVFEHNDLDPFGTPTALYLDEKTSALATAAAVDALADLTVSGTLSADPLFVNFPTDVHLQAGSPCDGAGTAAGAPATDLDGDPRDATSPDIGADER